MFPDPAMTLAVVDRLVLHATILELNVESYRRREAVKKKRGPGRPPLLAQPPTPGSDDAARQSEFRGRLARKRECRDHPSTATPSSHQIVARSTS